MLGPEIPNQGRLVFSHEQYAMFFYYVLSQVVSWRQITFCTDDVWQMATVMRCFFLLKTEKNDGCRLQEQIKSRCASLMQAVHKGTSNRGVDSQMHPQLILEHP